MALYYTNALAAAYMAKEYGVKYGGVVTFPDGVVGNVDIRIYIDGTVAPYEPDVVSFDGRYTSPSYGDDDFWTDPILDKTAYIHPDSYHIFSPQKFDRGQDKNKNDYWFNSEGEWEPFFTRLDLADARHNKPAFDKNWDVDSIKITQRNNKLFFMPESEDV